MKLRAPDIQEQNQEQKCVINKHCCGSHVRKGGKCRNQRVPILIWWWLQRIGVVGGMMHTRMQDDVAATHRKQMENISHVKIFTSCQNGWLKCKKERVVHCRCTSPVAKEKRRTERMIEMCMQAQKKRKTCMGMCPTDSTRRVKRQMSLPTMKMPHENHSNLLYWMITDCMLCDDICTKLFYLSC